LPNFDLQSGTLLVQIGGTLLVISDSYTFLLGDNAKQGAWVRG
jgi:hypothetical protein